MRSLGLPGSYFRDRDRAAEEETQAFRRAGRYLNLASFFFRARLADACTRVSREQVVLYACTLRVRPASSPSNTNRVRCTWHVMCRQELPISVKVLKREQLGFRERAKLRLLPDHLNGP